jgi:hypothetical protein
MDRPYELMLKENCMRGFEAGFQLRLLGGIRWSTWMDDEMRVV